jgi:uncharacterized protein YkwD
MDFGDGLAILLLMILIAIVIFFLTGFDVLNTDFVLNPPQATTTTSTTTTTTTTTTITLGGYSSTEEHGTIEWLEKYTFDLVNEERTANGLDPLAWNDEVTAVSRKHSQDMLDNGLFSHTGSDGSNSSYRLIRDGVMYWNLTGENIAQISGIHSKIMNSQGEVIDTNYKTIEEVAEDAVRGWMDSPMHRANILRAEFDEAGMGIKEADDTYYLTQNFIRRIHCGYQGADCCETKGFYPWCYDPWSCVKGLCE